MNEMSALAINSLLGGPIGGLMNQNLATAATKTTESTMIDRKHYSGGGGGGGGGGHHYSSHGYSDNSYGGKSKKKGRSIALTALTLLAFLFFLNILQQCLQEQMDQMNPQVVIMQARIQAARDAEAKEKEAEKRIGESLEKEKSTVSSLTDDNGEIPSFSKAQSLYHYDKMHVPIQLKNKERH